MYLSPYQPETASLGQISDHGMQQLGCDTFPKWLHGTRILSDHRPYFRQKMTPGVEAMPCLTLATVWVLNGEVPESVLALVAPNSPNVGLAMTLS